MTQPVLSKRAAVLAWAIHSSLALAAAALAVLLGVLFFLRPFWLNADQIISSALKVELPWSYIIVAVVFGLAALFGILAAKDARWRLEGSNKRIHPAVAMVALTLSAFAVGAVALVFVMLRRHERSFLEFQALAALPSVGMLAGAALVMLILPRFGFWRCASVRWVLFILLALAAAWTVFAPHPMRMLAGPWLQLAEDGGMTVCWMTDRSSTGEVEYGEGFKNRAHHSEYGLLETGTIHRVTLTGLQPGSLVPYRVVSREIRDFFPYSVRFGATLTGGEHAFTVPNPDADQVSFVLISDLHEATALLPNILNAADVRRRDFVVFNGDYFSNIDSEYQVLTRLLQPVSQEFASEIPFVFVRGNHDSRGAFARRLPEYLALPGNPFVSSFKIGPAEFLALDTGEDKPDDHREYSGLVDFTAWRAQETQMLASLAAADAWKSASFRILLAHIPLGNADSNGWRERFDAAGLDLQLAGHVHKTEYRANAGTFPVLIASGDSRRAPEAFPAAIVTVTRDRIDVNMITGAGAKVGHWELPVRVSHPQ
jgi:predicted MPP superfamily phosphohydrolase